MYHRHLIGYSRHKASQYSMNDIKCKSNFGTNWHLALASINLQNAYTLKSMLKHTTMVTLFVHVLNGC